MTVVQYNNNKIIIHIFFIKICIYRAVKNTNKLYKCFLSAAFRRRNIIIYQFLVSLQNLVNKMWVGVASEDKAELRSCLPKLLLSQHALLPFFIRNKLCKVIVDIGRQDWPMFYHDFFSNTLQVCVIHHSFSLQYIVINVYKCRTGSFFCVVVGAVSISSAAGFSSPQDDLRRAGVSQRRPKRGSQRWAEEAAAGSDPHHPEPADPWDSHSSLTDSTPPVPEFKIITIFFTCLFLTLQELNSIIW